jgi:hypothetical protein
MATLTGKLVAETYKALLKLIDNDVITGSEKQISDGLGGSTGVFIDTNGFLRASKFIVTGGNSGQFLKGDGSLDGTGYLPIGSTTSVIPEGSNLYFTNPRVLSTQLTGFVSTEGTVTAADTVLSAFNKIWWNIENGGGGGGGYVPYTGATQNLNLGTYGLISDYIQFNLAPTSIPTTAGTMSWNAADGTADLKMGGANVTLQVGQEELVRVVNKTGANLLEANYQAVRISGAQGNRLKVDLAKADNDANSADTIGLVTETINNNQEGFVTAVGLVRNIDTTGDLQTETWADGEMLYLSSTTAGAITNIKPEAPEHGVRLGYVVRAHKTQGQIYVKVDNGYELDELHNVLITDPLDEDVLFYDEANLLWINKNIYSAINATDVGKSLLGILNAEDTTPVTTKPRGIRINVDNTVDALEVGTQGYLPFYDDTDFYIDSPAWTDGTQVVIGDDAAFATGNKLSVVGNLAIANTFGYYIGANRILFRNNTTGEFTIGTTVANDFTTFYANSIERMRLSASGYLGIGLTSPTQPLHVKGVLAYPKIIIDNNSASGGGMFSAYQNGTETAMFGVSGAWLINNSSDAAIVATRAGQGIQFYTNGSNSEKMGINSDGNVFVGQTPTYVAGATQLIVRGKTGAGFLGVNHYDMSIKGSINTFNSVFQVGTSTFHSVAFIVEDIERARINSGGRMLLGTTTDNTVDKLQIDGSLIATAIKKSGGTSAQFLKADGSVDTTAYGTGSVTSVSATVPTGFAISGSPITTSGTLAITFASGYSLPTTIKQSNWDDAYTFVAAFPTQTGNAGKYLTTDGSSLSWGSIVSGVSSFNTRTGDVTLVSTDVINALNYTPVTNARTLTINGTTYDLSADRSWTIASGVSSFNTRTGAVTLTSSDVTTALGFTPVTQARTLTINGQGYDLSTDRAWTITPSSGMRNVTQYIATAGQTTFTITGGYTAGLIDIFLNGVRIPESDFTATNGTTVVFTTGVKVNDVVTAVLYTASATSGITGAGTANYLAKWSGTSAITNSLIYDNGTNVGIGTASPSSILHLNSASSNGTVIRLTSTSTNGKTYGIGSNFVSGAGEFAIYDYTAGAQRFFINSSGNIGIGTTTPFSVNGTNLEITSTTAFPSRLILTNSSASGRQYFFQNQGDGNLIIYDNTASTERFRITSSGFVGINTSNPGVYLDVQGGTINAFTAAIMANSTFTFGSTNGKRLVVLSSTQGDKNGLQLGYDSTDGTGIIAASTESAGAGLDFYTYNGSWASRVRIAKSGSLGIGTTNPRTYLHSATSASSGVLPSLGAIGDATALYLTNSNSLYGMLMGSLPSGNSWIQVQRTDGNATAYNLILQPNGGSVSVTGSLSKGSGSFRIDHPLKPKTHQLVHSFIEGPQADLIYRGKLNLVNGKGMANIDDVSSMTKGTFEALCRDVQCFTTNENGWDLVKGKVIGNIIYIESVNPNSTDEISWMVIGERKDKHMFDTEWTDEYGKVIVEPLKEIFNA